MRRPEDQIAKLAAHLSPRKGCRKRSRMAVTVPHAGSTGMGTSRRRGRSSKTAAGTPRTAANRRPKAAGSVGAQAVKPPCGRCRSMVGLLKSPLSSRCCQVRAAAGGSTRGSQRVEVPQVQDLGQLRGNQLILGGSSS